jgi:hypothetical protein
MVCLPRGANEATARFAPDEAEIERLTNEAPEIAAQHRDLDPPARVEGLREPALEQAHEPEAIPPTRKEEP